MRFLLKRACLTFRVWVILYAAFILAACSPKEQDAKVLIDLPEPTDAQKAAKAKMTYFAMRS
jgi:hypothetical protein